MEKFLRSTPGKLSLVPGIKEDGANEKIFMSHGIETSSQLFAVFMFGLIEIDKSLADESVSVELTDRFYAFLKNLGVNSHRNTIVEAVARKVNTWVPGVYDAQAYEC